MISFPSLKPFGERGNSSHKQRMIEVRGVCKSFRIFEKAPGLKASLRSLFRRRSFDRHALVDVSLKVAPGEIVGLIGANGAGKTTLIKILAGILEPSGGFAQVLGFTPFERKNEFRRQIALIMGQKMQLGWDLPAADCFLLLREIYDIDKRRCAERIDELSEALDVKRLLNVPIRRLSLGERMKMELMAALLHDPKVIFLDEPTIGLDIGAQHAIREFLKRYRARQKPAIILTSHYMEDIKALCERIVIMREGRFVYDGGLSEVLNQHTDHKVVTVHLDLDRPYDLTQGGLEIIAAEGAVVKIRAPRDHVTGTVARALETLPVVDLAIEEQEIGSIIERLMRRERAA